MEKANFGQIVSFLFGLQKDDSAEDGYPPF